MALLVLIRHGETDKNISKSLHAANDVESLNANGRRQIELTAKRLREFSPIKVYSSKERRAIESADIISQALVIPSEEIDGMQERNWGVFTGKPWEEVKKILDPMSLDERYEYVPPQGESWKTFENRLKAAVRKIIGANKGETVAVVTHGGAIRALMPYLLSVPKEESFKYDPENASLTIFEVSNDSFRQIVANDTAHLTK